jgi:hypothetical protein
MLPINKYGTSLQRGHDNIINDNKMSFGQAFVISSSGSGIILHFQHLRDIIHYPGKVDFINSRSASESEKTLYSYLPITTGFKL